MAATTRRLDPDGLPMAVLLAFLATAGLFYVNIMAALVDGLHRALGFSLRDAGLVGSFNTYGAAAGSLVAALVITRLPWRRTAVVLLAVMLALDLVSLTLSSPTPLMAARFAHGLAGGMLIGLGLSLIARTRTPERGFGVLLFLQFSLGGLGVMVLPRLTAAFGERAVFGALIAMSLTTLAMLPFIRPSDARKAAQAESGAAPAVSGLMLSAGAVASIFLYQAASMGGVSAYLLGMGEAFGHSADFTSATVGAGSWIGLVGAGAVVLFGVRFGRLVPILGAVAVTVAGILMFLFWGDQRVAWTAANAITSAAWSFVIPYIYGLCSAFDTEGRTTLWAGFLSKLGLATGPAAGAFILAETHYARLLWAAAAVATLSGLVAAPAALRLDRKAGPRPTAGPVPVEA